MLSEIRNNRTEPNIYEATHKVLTLSDFLAIALVRQPSTDVVAVAIDYVNVECVKIAIARNESTSQDVVQAKLLQKLFLDYFINRTTDNSTFKRDFLITMLGWGRLDTNVALRC